MTALRGLLAVVALLEAGSILPSQDARERALRAWERGDPAVAAAALLELFAADDPDRPQALQASLDAFRNAGGTDVWLDAASKRARVHSNDAALLFYLGVTWQDLKHLRRAEEALSQARALAPQDPGVQEAFAWNARLRFDTATAVERARGASFAGADRFRADQEARLAHSGTPGALAGFAILGLALVAGTLFVLTRVAR